MITKQVALTTSNLKTRMKNLSTLTQNFWTKKISSKWTQNPTRPRQKNKKLRLKKNPKKSKRKSLSKKTTNSFRRSSLSPKSPNRMNLHLRTPKSAHRKILSLYRSPISLHHRAPSQKSKIKLIQVLSSLKSRSKLKLSKKSSELSKPRSPCLRLKNENWSKTRRTNRSQTTFLSQTPSQSLISLPWSSLRSTHTSRLRHRNRMTMARTCCPRSLRWNRPPPLNRASKKSPSSLRCLSRSPSNSSRSLKKLCQRSRLQ